MPEPYRQKTYGNRGGYDPFFLGSRIPLPAIRRGARSQLSHQKGRDGYIVHYHHFSLVLHAERRLAVYTAANVDAGKRREGGKYSRRRLAGLRENESETWFVDPRVPDAHQLPDKFYSKDRRAFDKGHIVRRQAVAWGSSYEEIRNANGDTFHVTNCSPQVLGFNRSSQGGIWGRLENSVLNEAKDERLCVFAGPVLSASDPKFKGVDDDGEVHVRIPRPLLESGHRARGQWRGGVSVHADPGSVPSPVQEAS